MSTDTLLWRPRARMISYTADQIADITDRIGAPDPGMLRLLEEIVGMQPSELDARLAAEGITDARAYVSASRIQPEFGDWVDGNLVVTTGLTRIGNLIIGSAVAAFSNARGFAGVGSSNTAAAVGDTALGGSGNASTAWYRGLDATFPTFSAGTITANATFTGSDAAFAWNEWCWGITDSGTITPAHTLASVGTGSVMINHKVAALGSKAAGGTATLNSQLTLA